MKSAGSSSKHENTKERVLILEARFYEELADQLAAGAIGSLEAAGVTVERLAVPGCFELPSALAGILRSPQGKRYGGYVALGCVIRGETDHYDFICQEVSRGLMDLSINPGCALGFGVLTCHDYEQAWARADVNGKNKGGDAAEACLRMIALRRSLNEVG